MTILRLKKKYDGKKDRQYSKCVHDDNRYSKRQIHRRPMKTNRTVVLINLTFYGFIVIHCQDFTDQRDTLSSFYRSERYTVKIL